MNMESLNSFLKRAVRKTTPMKFRKLPIVIEAVKIKAVDYNPALGDEAFDGAPFSETPEWILNAVKSGKLCPVTPGSTDYAEWEIDTLEGKMLASPGDWVIQGVNGEIYPCKSDIFEKTYEKVTETL